MAKKKKVEQETFELHSFVTTNTHKLFQAWLGFVALGFEEAQAFTNRLANDEEQKEFVKALMTEHRTLQQSVFDLMCKCIQTWAKTPEDRYDARNEFTIKTCKKIVDRVEEVKYSAPMV